VAHCPRRRASESIHPLLEPCSATLRLQRGPLFNEIGNGRQKTTRRRKKSHPDAYAGLPVSAFETIFSNVWRRGGKKSRLRSSTKKPKDHVADTIENLTNRGAAQPCSSSDVYGQPTSRTRLCLGCRGRGLMSRRMSGPLKPPLPLHPIPQAHIFTDWLRSHSVEIPPSKSLGKKLL
jgi:hypothetical protein